MGHQRPKDEVVKIIVRHLFVSDEISFPVMA